MPSTSIGRSACSIRRRTSFYLETREATVFGASPEMLVRCRGRVVETRPIAGTAPRGATPAEDDALAAALLADPKERAEHVMLVDLARNDLGRVCAIGSVRVPRYASIEKYSHVQHIVSEVTGTLAPGKTAADALAACFPAGTLTGAPKIRAMELIDELEAVRRGIYGGVVGYLDSAGNLDVAIAIRTAVVEKGVCRVQAGAGIVADSVPEKEYAEAEFKAEALFRAIDLARSWSSKSPHIHNSQFTILNFSDDLLRRQLRFLHLQPRADGGPDRLRRRGRAQRPLRSARGRRSPAVGHRHLSRPGRPENAGKTIDMIRAADEAGIPLLGVCLGHQAIAAAYGGVVERAPAPRHGKSSWIAHSGTDLFAQLPNPFEAGRYHSLVVREENLPAQLEVVARSDDGLVMALAHRTQADPRRSVPSRVGLDAGWSPAPAEFPGGRPMINSPLYSTLRFFHSQFSILNSQLAVGRGGRCATSGREFSKRGLPVLALAPPFSILNSRFPSLRHSQFTIHNSRLLYDS